MPPEIVSDVKRLDSPEFWEITRGGIVVMPEAVLNPSTMLYRVTCWTLCGKEQATIDVACTRSMKAAELARRARICGSIYHWRQNRCLDCHAHFRFLTPAEREWIHSTDPTLGDIMGMNAENKG